MGPYNPVCIGALRQPNFYLLRRHDLALKSVSRQLVTGVHDSRDIKIFCKKYFCNKLRW